MVGMVDRRLSFAVTSLRVELIAKAILTPAIILYTSEASMLLVTLLLLVELQCIMLPVMVKADSSLLVDSFAKIISYLIWLLKSLLFANELSIKINNFVVKSFSSI